jgi:glycogen debranching enzyme
MKPLRKIIDWILSLFKRQTKTKETKVELTAKEKYRVWYDKKYSGKRRFTKAPPKPIDGGTSYATLSK